MFMGGLSKVSERKARNNKVNYIYIFIFIYITDYNSIFNFKY